MNAVMRFDRLRLFFARLWAFVRGGDLQNRGQYNGEMGHFIASWGQWPGHEANFPILARLLWEIGKKAEAVRQDGDYRNHKTRSGSS